MTSTTHHAAKAGQQASADGLDREAGPSVGLAALTDCTEQDCETLYALGHHLYSQARYLDALNVFGMLITLKSLEHRFVFGFGSCLQMLGRYEEAVNHYATALFVDVDNPTPLLHTCECLLALGHHEHARDALKVIQAQYSHDLYPGVMKKAAKLSVLLSCPATESTGRKQ